MQQKNTFNDSNSTFYSSTGFAYRFKQQLIDYTLLHSRQIDDIKHLFKNQKVLKQENILQLFEKFNNQNNRYIQTLLDDLSQTTKKGRINQESMQGKLRQNMISNRKLCEEVIDAKSQLTKQKIASKKVIEGLIMQLDEQRYKNKKFQTQINRGSGLLNEYQKEIEKLQKNMKKISQQCIQRIQETNRLKQQFEQMAKSYQQSNIQCQKLQKENISLKKQLKSATEQINKKQNQIKELSRLLQQLKSVQEQLEIRKIYIEQILKQTQNQNNQWVLQQKRYVQEVQAKNVQVSSLKSKIQLLTNKITEFQSSTNKNMQLLKASYNKKIKKIANFATKRMKDIKNELAQMKLKISKQLLVSLKLTKADIIECLSLRP